MISFLKMNMSGLVFAGIMTIAGFSFFGKNIFNTIPIYVGIYLFTRLQKLDFKSFMIVVLFSTGISPIVSFMIFGIVRGRSGSRSLPLGIMQSVFQLVLSSVWTRGLCCRRWAPIPSVSTKATTSTTSASRWAFSLWGFRRCLEALMLLTVLLSIIFILIAYINDAQVHRKHLMLMRSTGRLVSDFIRDYGRSVSLLNVGITGILCAAVLTVLQFEINGPVRGAILTVMGFGAFGKHPRNTIPVMVGAYLAVMLTDHTFHGIGMMIAVLFVSAVSFIAGRYGVLADALAGFIHVVITPWPLCSRKVGSTFIKTASPPAL